MILAISDVCVMQYVSECVFDNCFNINILCLLKITHFIGSCVNEQWLGIVLFVAESAVI